jgi:hypothetical protein
MVHENVLKHSAMCFIPNFLLIVTLQPINILLILEFDSLNMQFHFFCYCKLQIADIWFYVGSRLGCSCYPILLLTLPFGGHLKTCGSSSTVRITGYYYYLIIIMITTYLHIRTDGIFLVHSLLLLPY